MNHEYVFQSIFCLLSKVLTHIQMLLSLAAFPDIKIQILQYLLTHMHFKQTQTPSRLLLATSCVQAPLHNSLATVLALVHTHPSS